MEESRTIGVIAIKGGVGKTSVVSALGAALANEFNKKVLLIDANFSAPNLALHFGIVNPEKTIHHVLNNASETAEAIHKTEYGFDVMPGSLIADKIDPFKLKNKIKNLKKEYDIILLDSSPTLNEEILATMVASDNLVVVTTPDYPTLSATLRATMIARQRQTPIIGIVLNKTRNKRFELSVDEIEKATGIKVLAVVPDDIRVLEALAKTVPSTLYRQKSDSTIEYKKLAATLIGEHYVDRRLKTKLKKFFWPSIKKQDINRTIINKQI